MHNSNNNKLNTECNVVNYPLNLAVRLVGKQVHEKKVQNITFFVVISRLIDGEEKKVHTEVNK